MKMREVFANENFVVSVGGGSETRESLEAKIRTNEAKMKNLMKSLMTTLQQMKEQLNFKILEVESLEDELDFKKKEIENLKKDIKEGWESLLRGEKLLLTKGMKGE